MKIRRTQRVYTNALIKIIGMEVIFPRFEFELGLKFLKDTGMALFMYNDWKRSTIFWNWYCQQIDNISKQALYTTGIDISEDFTTCKKSYALKSLLESEGIESSFQGLTTDDIQELKDTWEFYYNNFLNKGIMPSSTIVNQIIKENVTRNNNKTQNRKAKVSAHIAGV